MLLYGSIGKGAYTKIGLIAINEYYTKKQMYLNFSKLDKFSEFIVVPLNNKKYSFYASTNHGDLFLFFEDYIERKSTSKIESKIDTTPNFINTDGNLVLNPNFENEDLKDNNAWEFIRQSTAAGEVKIKDNQAILTCINGTLYQEDLQFCQSNIPLKANTEYVLKFDAYADNPIPTFLTITSPSKGFYSFLKKNISLTSSK